MKDKKIKWVIILGFFILGIGSCSVASSKPGWDGLVPALLGLGAMVISFFLFFISTTVDYIAGRKKKNVSTPDKNKAAPQANFQLISHDNLKASLIFFGIADLLLMIGNGYGYSIIIWLFRMMVFTLLLILYSKGNKWILYIMLLALLSCIIISIVALFFSSNGILHGVVLFIAPFLYYYVIYILMNDSTEGLLFKEER